MRHFYRVVACVTLTLAALSSCSYDDGNLWEEVEQIKNRVTTLEEAAIKANQDIVALQTIVGALQKNVYVDSVTPTANGYTILFTDGTTTNISNGANGTNGTNAPIISVKQHSDGNYYWTANDEWLLVDGERVRANGIDGENGENGENGEDAIAPQIRINATTKEWEISTDGGITWLSTGVVAEGKDGSNGSTGAAGDSLFKKVDTSNPDYIIITLANGTELRLARYDQSAPKFIIADCPKLVQVEHGKSVELIVDADNIADYVPTAPLGWRADYDTNILTITAPAKDMCHFDKEGILAISVVSEQGKSAVVKLNVMAGEWVEEEQTTLRTLTFEDEDATFEPYELSYCGAYIETWSDLIAADQYMDTLIYDMSGSEPYYWFDENNTMLYHEFPCNYGSYAYWGGGHAISNYANLDFETYGDYMSQLTVFGEEGMGGNNSSSNFCMHFGYMDGSDYNGTDELSKLYMGDGIPRVIDHMYVNVSTYVLNCLLNGNGLTDPAGSDDKFYITATGYDLNEETTGTVEFALWDDANEIFITEWTKWDLTSLGEVIYVEFNVLGTNDNGYGFSQPAYFAYDDVAVQFTESREVFK